jgi:hypothetical protein
MKSRLNQLYNMLGFKKENGLFFLDEANLWSNKFPYRISRILIDVIKPVAFFSIYNNISDNDDHPRPSNQSFILFFDNPTYDEEELIHKRIINFGLAQIVFINRDETLDLYHGNDFSLANLKTLTKLKSSSSVDDFNDYSFINQIRGNVFDCLGKKKNLIDTYLLRNITDARRILVASDGYNLLPKVANRLIGRLLFTNYLIDRNVTFNDQDHITGNNREERRKVFRELILNKTNLYEFFKYLNHKYNGDMFPLIEYDEKHKKIYDEEEYVNGDHLKVLNELFSSSEFFGKGVKYSKNYAVQGSLFNLYDFEIIPVELISSIYENFIGNADENENLKLTKQKEIKAYYTPPYIVDYILSQTITPFLEDTSKKDSNCKVLDPACGSGIFLVETIRKIIEKEFRLTGKNKIPDQRLWKLIKSNIYGIDIDEDAIDISIFSLYITLLDYKQPREIEKFKFQTLKGENFFGGKDADFFNLDHSFNSIIKGLDFIIGNPPWGNVPKERSRYIDYIIKRNAKENEDKAKKDMLSLQIGDKEICQAFLVRTSDFISGSKSPKCSFIISSKVLYNTGKPAKIFRNYFLQKFHLKQVIELSLINNKIRGKEHVFDKARQPAAIINFTPKLNNESIAENVIRHITVKPNKFFIYYKTIVIEKHDVKRIKQEYFIEKFGGYDWLWKVLVHGNALDIHFIKRLKNPILKTAVQYFDEKGYKYKTGLKIIDKSRKDKDKKDSTVILNYDYLDADKDFKPFCVSPRIKWKDEVKLKEIKNAIIDYLPSLNYFEGNKLLIKSGIVIDPTKSDEHYFNAISAFNDKKLCFTADVCSIKHKSDNSIESKYFLSCLSGLFNSKLFTYFLLTITSSAGIERSRLHFGESFNFPVIINKKISELTLSITNEIYNLDEKKIKYAKDKIDEIIYDIYNISETEKALIDYAINVSIPVLLRKTESKIFKKLGLNKSEDINLINNYADIFKKFFQSRFSRIKKTLITEILYSDYYLRINFHVETIASGNGKINSIRKDNEVDLLGDLGIYKACKDLYIRQDVRGFTPTSFYIIKPNEYKLWHPAIAYLDALEFEEELIKEEIKQFQMKKHNERG